MLYDYSGSGYPPQQTEEFQSEAACITQWDSVKGKEEREEGKKMGKKQEGKEKNLSII